MSAIFHLYESKLLITILTLKIDGFSLKIQDKNRRFWYFDNKQFKIKEIMKSLSEQNEVFMRKQDCRVRFSSMNKIFKCGITFNKNKILEFHLTPKDNQNYAESSNIWFPDPKVRNLQLNLKFSVSLVQKPIFPRFQSNKFHGLQISTDIIITDIRSEKKLRIKWVEDSMTQIRPYFQECMWIDEDINFRYEIVQEISNKDSCNKKRKFLLMKDLLSFQNKFVKKYEKKYFIDKFSGVIDIESIIKQVKLQNLLSHKHIMRYNQFLTDSDNFYLFYEQKPTRILSELLSDGKQLKSNRIKTIIEQLLLVLSELEILQVAHNNIHLSSVFVIESNDNWKISLGEFQYAHFTDQIDRIPVLSQAKNKRYFLAPELISSGVLDYCGGTLSDIYSLGVLFYELLFRNPDHRAKFIEQRFQQEPINFESSHIKKLPLGCANLLKLMLDDNKLRISPIEALNHSIFIENQTSSAQNSIRSQALENNTLESREFLGLGNEKKRERREVFIQQNFPQNFITRNPKQNSESSSLETSDIYPTDHLESELISDEQEFDNESIQDKDIDDSHQSISLRDIRIMRPAWIFHQNSKIFF